MRYDEVLKQMLATYTGLPAFARLRFMPGEDKLLAGVDLPVTYCCISVIICCSGNEALPSCEGNNPSWSVAQNMLEV